MYKHIYCLLNSGIVTQKRYSLQIFLAPLSFTVFCFQHELFCNRLNVLCLMLIQHISNHTKYIRNKCEKNKQLKKSMNEWETERDKTEWTIKRRRRKKCTKYLIIWTIEWITTDVGLVESYWRQRVYIHCSKGPIYSHLFCVNNRNESNCKSNEKKKKKKHILYYGYCVHFNPIESKPIHSSHAYKNVRSIFFLSFLDALLCGILIFFILSIASSKLHLTIFLMI